MTRGKFITFEGIDGAGKTTHLDWFRRQLEALVAGRGHQVVVTREPGGTPLGETLRELLLHHAMHLETEALLMFAARREHLEQVILPALARGDWVLSDRFTDASFAYQGGGRGLARAKLEALEQWVQDGLQPDLTILLLPDLEASLRRARRRNHRQTEATGADESRFERERDDFFARVYGKYREIAAREPLRVVAIEGDKSVAEVHKQVIRVVEERLHLGKDAYAAQQKQSLKTVPED